VVSDRLAEERRSLGLTQEALGKVGGVTKKTQLGYEKGTASPTADYLLKIREAGADVVYVLTGVRSNVAQEPSARYSTDETATLTQQQHEQAIRAALLNTITNSRKFAHRLSTEQFIAVTLGVYGEFLKELQSGDTGILTTEEAVRPGQTGTNG